jgi:methionyl-tRNA formyltransferase
MRLVVISTLGAAQLHVIAETARRHPVVSVLRPVRPRPAPAAAPALTDRWARFRAAPLAVVRDRFEQRVRQARMERLETQLAARLFGGTPPHLDVEEVPLPVLSSPEMIDRLHSLSPDLLLVAGAPILKPAIFGVARLGTVNLHYGVAPHYRGEDTLFWPLLHEDWDHLGVTLHFIDAGVDTGRVIAHGFPLRHGGEGEADLWASSARVGAKLVHRFLAMCETQMPKGRPQEPGGKQYFRRERTAQWEARYWVKRALGKVPPPAGERIVFYD